MTRQDDSPFHDGEREMQRRMETTRLADRVAEVTFHDFISDNDREFIERRDMFFLATGDADGNLDCSYKGGEPGFVRVLDEHTVAFPNYDGNGMYMSTGNILEHNRVGMLFIDWENQWRMRLNGTATISFDSPLLAEYPEAQFMVIVRAEHIFPNCPRYIHRMQVVERSVFVPRKEKETPEPEWKDHFEEALSDGEKARRAAKKGRPAAG